MENRPNISLISLVTSLWRLSLGFCLFFTLLLAFTKTVVALDKDFWSLLSGTFLCFVQRNCRIDSKQDCVYFFHTWETRINSVQRTLGEGEERDGFALWTSGVGSSLCLRWALSSN